MTMERQGKPVDSEVRRRLGALLAWLDEEHRFSADAEVDDLAVRTHA
jgi:hypothetical protein